MTTASLVRISDVRDMLKVKDPDTLQDNLLGLGRSYKQQQTMFYFNLYCMYQLAPWAKETWYMDDGTPIEHWTDYREWMSTYVHEHPNTLYNVVNRIERLHKRNVSWDSIIKAIVVCPMAIDDLFDKKGDVKLKNLPPGGVQEVVDSMIATDNPTQARRLIADMSGRPLYKLDAVFRRNGSIFATFSKFTKQDIKAFTYEFKPIDDSQADVGLEEWILSQLGHRD